MMLSWKTRVDSKAPKHNPVHYVCGYMCIPTDHIEIAMPSMYAYSLEKETEKPGFHLKGVCLQ